MRTRSVQRVTELAECALLLAFLELNVPELVGVEMVVAPDSEGIKVAEVLMVKEEVLGVDKVTVEKDVVVVVHGRKKTNLTAKNLPGWFLTLHLLWSS